mmetsp:Transcript_147/g.496  ORF Transcript_147/g.496 Transcript_147/m.496 type:complete len:238 (-) Transcript_147:524-1237(-)
MRTLVEVLECQPQVPLPLGGAVERDIAQPVVGDWLIVLSNGLLEEHLGFAQIRLDAESHGVDVAEECKCVASGFWLWWVICVCCGHPEELAGLGVILLEAIDAQQIPLANCCLHRQIALFRELYEYGEFALFGPAVWRLGVVYAQPDELECLRQPHAVDLGDPLGHLDVVERRRQTYTRHTVPVQMPVPQSHQRTRMGGKRCGIEVQHRLRLVPLIRFAVGARGVLVCEEVAVKEGE